MKKFISLCSALIILSFQIKAQVAVKAQPLTYKNPLPVALGDPYVLYEEGKGYYMYGTGGGAENGFSAYSSPDLVSWKYVGQVYYGNNEKGWGTGSYWAP